MTIWFIILGLAVTTALVAAAVLFVLSVGSVRGFALYLGVTTICDLDVDGTKHRVIPRDFQLDPVMDNPLLDIDTTIQEGVAVVRLRGELDVRGCAGFGEQGLPRINVSGTAPPSGGTRRSPRPLGCPYNCTGGDWSRLRSCDQGKRAEEGNDDLVNHPLQTNKCRS